MYPFSLPPTATPEEVVSTVDTHGVACIEGALPAEVVDRLTEEWDRLSKDTSPWANREEYSLGTAIRMIRREIDRDRYPVMLEVFEDGWLEDVVRLHYGDGYVFAEKIYAILDVVGSDTIVQELHYDKVQHMKIFYYLSDVSIDCGPFHCVPGSHMYCAELQMENRARGIIPTDRDTRVLPREYHDMNVPVTGRPGTLIIFNSDIAHSAGTPTGGARLAMRSLNFGPRSLGKRV